MDVGLPMYGRGSEGVRPTRRGLWGWDRDPAHAGRGFCWDRDPAHAGRGFCWDRFIGKENDERLCGAGRYLGARVSLQQFGEVVAVFEGSFQRLGELSALLGRSLQQFGEVVAVFEVSFQQLGEVSADFLGA